MICTGYLLLRLEFISFILLIADAVNGIDTAFMQ